MVRRPAKTRAQAAPSGLALHDAAARAEALLKERERLLRDVNKKKQQIAHARAKAEREEQAAVGAMTPIVKRHAALVRELTELFDELLAPGRLLARARNEVKKVRRSLELQGLLPPLAASDRGSPDEATEEPWDEDWPDEPSSASAGRRRPSDKGQRQHPHGSTESAAREVASAHQPSPERRSLRDIFRSLARAVHPDQARQEPERVRRTEVMKEVTRAYEQGDLARLIELENAWQSDQALQGGENSEARCRELARINRELLNQVRQLTRELRDVKRDAREAAGGPLDEVVEQAGRELDDFSKICDFVRTFRDGKSTLNEFARGPSF